MRWTGTRATFPTPCAPLETRMTHSPENRPAADTITLTRADLISLAEKIASNERCEVSKPQVLNMIAAEILGPKHDWSRIKNAEGSVASQRAQSRTPKQEEAAPGKPTEFHTDLEDLETGDRLSAKTYITASGIEIDIADGTHVWVERNNGIQKVHVYNDLSDGPVSTWSEPGSRIVVKQDGYEGDAFANLNGVPLAGSNEKPIIGYQVDCPIGGDNWGNRPSYEILPYEVALKDFQEAQKAGETSYRILPIRKGSIEEPTFLEV
jgi:hypothetical protein